MASEAPNPSGAHRGGLRGSDEDVDAIDKDVAMAGSEDACATTGATPLVPPATRKLCVRHQRNGRRRHHCSTSEGKFIYHPVHSPLPPSLLQHRLAYPAVP